MLEVAFHLGFGKGSRMELTQNIPEICGIPLVATELDKNMAVFSSNLKFHGLFLSTKCCRTAAFRFVLTTIINSLGVAIFDFVTRRPL